MKQIRFFFQKTADSNFPRLSFLKSKTLCVRLHEYVSVRVSSCEYFSAHLHLCVSTRAYTIALVVHIYVRPCTRTLIYIFVCALLSA